MNKLYSIAIILGLCGAASADGVTKRAAKPKREPGLFSYKRLYFRAGALHVATSMGKSSPLSLHGVDGPATLAVQDGPVMGSGVSLDPVTRPAIITGIELPWWGGRVSLETVLSTPFTVKFKATGTLASMSLAPDAQGIPTGIPPLGSELGEAKAAPPLATAVVRVAELGPVRPYLGTGVSMLYAYDAKATNKVLTEVGQPTFNIDPAFGWVLQAGTDVQLWKQFHLRADVKYVAFMTAHASVENIQVKTPDLPLLERATVGSATMDLTVNPLIVSVGVGADL